MTSMKDKLNKVKAALVSVTGKNTYYGHRPSNVTGDYIVWGINGESDHLDLDGIKAGQIVDGWIEFHSKTPMNSKIDDLQAALNDAEDVSFLMEQYESYGDPTREDDNSYHTTFSFEVV